MTLICHFEGFPEEEGLSNYSQNNIYEPFLFFSFGPITVDDR